MKKLTEEPEEKATTLSEMADKLNEEVDSVLNDAFKKGFDDGISSRDAEVNQLKDDLKKLQDKVKAILNALG